MSRAWASLTLRLLGPALELLCLWALLNPAARSSRVFGLALEPWLYAGLAIGLAMVAIGLGLRPRS